MNGKDIYCIAHEYYEPMSRLKVPDCEIERIANGLSTRFINDTEGLIKALKAEVEKARMAKVIRA